MGYPIILQKTPGGCSHDEPLDIVDALLQAFDFDAHIVQYEGDVRVNKESIAETPLVLSVELYDFDNKQLPDAERKAWSLDALSKLPEGFCGYRTSGGFRAVTLRQTPFVVKDAETWEDWRAYHGGRAEALGALIGAEPDHATDEPNRLFRLPLAKREDGKPSYAEIYGDLGYAPLAPAPYVRKAATEVYVGGNAQHSKAGAAFSAAGLVQSQDGSKLIVTCPWYREHTGANTGGTFIDDTEDHLGHFVCGHSHCKDKGRDTWKAIEVLSGLPAVVAELGHWPEPASVLETYQRQEAAEAPKPAAEAAPAAATPKPSGWLSWADLMSPLPPIEWLCQDLQLCPGRPAALVAEPNAGKTWSLQALALAVATGAPVFGAFPCTQGPVLHVSTDAGEYATRWRYQMLARGMGLEGRDLPIRVWPGRLRCVNKFGDFDMAGLAPILEESTKMGAKLVILDSLFAIAAGLDMMAPEAAEPLWATKNLPGVWLWAMHSPKGKPGFFGSQAIAAACGAMWNMTLQNDDKTKARQWNIGRRVEEYQGDVLEAFQTSWERDVDNVGTLLGARIERVLEAGKPAGTKSPTDLCIECFYKELEKRDAKGLRQSQLLQSVDHIKMRTQDKRAILHELEERKSIVRIVNGNGFSYHLGANTPDRNGA